MVGESTQRRWKPVCRALAWVIVRRIRP